MEVKLNKTKFCLIVIIWLQLWKSYYYKNILIIIFKNTILINIDIKERLLIVNLVTYYYSRDAQHDWIEYLSQGHVIKSVNS